MEEEMLSMVSHPRMNMNEESWEDSYIDNGYKHLRVERFKGVVPQQNGHWGAQIYANHQRIWLGTFRSEVDAAMAYDSASIKLRSGDCHRNFPFTNVTISEPKFQSHFSTDEILNMIRDGSYPSKFDDFLRIQKGEVVDIGLNVPSILNDGQFFRTLLFQKELTPSDVGKLNRLVIPKRYAVKHFPNVSDPGEYNVEKLEFHDREMKKWYFRYCYWNSSQSFVFTKGWNKFVKEKGLKANDTILFYTYERLHFGSPFRVIDHVDNCRNDPRNVECKKRDLEGEAVEDEKLGDQSNFTKGFKLFGVQIG